MSFSKVLVERQVFDGAQSRALRAMQRRFELLILKGSTNHLSVEHFVHGLKCAQR